MRKFVIVISAIALAATGCQKSPSADQALVTPVAPAAPSAPAPANAAQGQASTLSQALAIPQPQAAAPSTKEDWINLGNYQMDNGNYSEAIAAYQKALDLDPSNVDVRVDMGTCYRNIGQPDKAIEIYKKALEINPRHPNAWLNSGIVYYYDLHKNTEALQSFQKYLEVSPNSPNAATALQIIAKIKAGN